MTEKTTHPGQSDNRKWNNKLVLFMLNLAWATWIPLLYALYLYFETRAQPGAGQTPSIEGDHMVISILVFAAINLAIQFLLNLSWWFYTRGKKSALRAN